LELLRGLDQCFPDLFLGSNEISDDDLPMVFTYANKMGKEHVDPTAGRYHFFLSISVLYR